uniref:SMI1/KNR4 family protein n=1 Tax=Nonomuraea pusilla TaxID=46177 RepID=UPI001F36439E|nr:SMI1/KNR4 family protein [Nonomuraea pusilla]
MPIALAEVAEVGFEWEWDEEADEARGCDFEPYDRFEEPGRTAWWFRLWTGNQEADGSEFRFFGTTGAGDYTGFWLVRPDAAITDQPVVHIGSEGEHGLIARDLGGLLWLFAAGLGPPRPSRTPAPRQSRTRRSAPSPSDTHPAAAVPPPRSWLPHEQSSRTSRISSTRCAAERDST